jgi:hypothetical protein
VLPPPLLPLPPMGTVTRLALDAVCANHPLSRAPLKELLKELLHELLASL